MNLDISTPVRPAFTAWGYLIIIMIILVFDLLVIIGFVNKYFSFAIN